jgi:hypothetical protein
MPKRNMLLRSSASSTVMGAMVVAAAWAAGCGDDAAVGGGGSGPAAGSGGVAAAGGVGGGGGPTGGTAGAGGQPYDECTLGDAYCTGYAMRQVCNQTPSGTRWAEESCDPGSGCVLGQCVVGECSDECTLGQTQGNQVCELYDLATASWTTPDQSGSLRDRTRVYEQWLRRDALAFGGVGSARYADPPDYTTVAYMDGIGDSAIWTGTYLAAEALRLIETGEPAARANVVAAVQTLHLWFNVSGDPGVLARFAKLSSATVPYVIGDLQDCVSASNHCGVPYDGDSYDYIGHISRDQYQGVMLGYSLAYQALSAQDEPTRELIRGDVVELVQELMTDRTVPISITLDGVTIPQFDADLRFVVLCTREMVNGALQFVVDTNDVSSAEQWGFQEFTPDLKDILKQIPIIGPNLPAIPRASSAIMLASFFRVAMQVTDGVAAYADARAAIIDYYLNHAGEGGNVNDWLDVAKLAGPDNACGDHYFGANITMEPMYNWARLEDDPGRQQTIRQDVLGAAWWPKFVNTKNCFFSFIYAGNTPGYDPAVVTSAVTQLSGFPNAPRVRYPVDLRNDPQYMPHESGCTDQCSHATAVDVAVRPWADFMWQRIPWGLYDSGDLTQTAPGVDYLVAYWLGRHHAFLADDAPGRCAAWK